MPPSVATGTGRLISLPRGKSLEDKQVVHRSAARLPRRGGAGEEENTQASACSGCLGVGVRFSRAAIQALFVFWSGSRAKEVQITDSFVAAELGEGFEGGRREGGLVEGVEWRK